MAFNSYDKEKKGEIPTSLLGTIMKNLGHNLKPEQLEECIEAVDADGSGWIDFDEFLALMAKKTKEAEDEKELREAFRVFDKNNRGVIEAADLKLIFQTLDPDMPDEEVEQIIADVDEDGSGTVDFEGDSIFQSFNKFNQKNSSQSFIFIFLEFLKLMSG
jgi:Ca2+-binding EF-hand superfamily protein